MNEQPNKYQVDFVVKLEKCEPFTSIYSEIKKFCKEMIKQDLIKDYKIDYK